MRITLSIFVISFAACDPAPPTTDVEHQELTGGLSHAWSSGFDPALAQALGSNLQSRQQALSATGAVAGVYTSDGTVWLGGAGTSNGSAQMMFWTPTAYGSMTKTVTATALLILRDQGALALDDTVDQFGCGGERGCGYGIPNADTMTVEHLLSMQSGIGEAMTDPSFGVNYVICNEAFMTMGWWDEDVVLDFAQTMPPQFAPGAATSYNNTGFVVLSLILAEAGGYADYVEAIGDLIFDPMQMTLSVIEHDAQPWYATGYGLFGGTNGRRGCTGDWDGASGVVAYSGDVLRFWAALNSGGIPGLTDASYREMVTPRGYDAAHSAWYGLGMLLVEDPSGLRLHAHGGGVAGFVASAAHVPTAGLSIASNSTRELGDPLRTIPSSTAALVMAWVNQSGHSDVNDDGLVDGLDAWAVFVDISLRGERKLPNPAPLGAGPGELGFVDVDGDGFARWADYFRIIDELNSTCSDDADCPLPQMCGDGGTCGTPLRQCTSTLECPPMQQCIAGYCG